MCILVVDDNAEVCQILAEILSVTEQEVFQANGVETALELAAQHAGEIKLVITEVNLPTMDGPQMWSRLEQIIGPDCKVLFLAGHSKGLDSVPGEILIKPFALDTLLTKVGTMLRKSA